MSEKTRLILFLPACALFLLFAGSCQQSHKLSPELEQGRQLALTHCASCHQAPDPSLLDKKTWTKRIMPAMAGGLGIGVYQGSSYYSNPRLAKRSPLSLADWKLIVNYYDSLAPAVLKPAPVPVPLRKDWGVFKLVLPPLAQTLCGTTMVYFDSTDQTLYTSNAFSMSLDTWTSSIALKKSFKIKSPIVNAFFSLDSACTQKPKERKFVITNIGNMFPSNFPAGSVEYLSPGKVPFQEALEKPVLVGDRIIRPVQTIEADFNKDGIPDYAVCGFGHQIGGLFLYTGLKTGGYKKSVIREMPGAEQAILGDFDHDGWPDLIVLFAQADEGIWMFLNDHKGGFKTKKLMGFPPVYGSTSIQLVDFNKDGRPDILYTSGDNADYSPILKPFHGVYIFENLGNWKFKQRWFYPVNGCMKAIAEDFNRDGRIDIASIAFSPDWKNKPEEAVIYFQQDAPMHFIPHAIPVDRLGHFLVMTAADLDNDGYKDLVLGSFSLPSAMGTHSAHPVEGKYPFIVLKNLGKNAH